MNFIISAAVDYVKSVANEVLKRINCGRFKTCASPDGSTAIEESETEYTTEQQEAVWRIERCDDYYEMLGVTKQAPISVIRRAYRKLARQVHPDKNKAPGSEEAFKTIARAVAVLTDIRNRELYDRHPDWFEGRTRRTPYDRTCFTRLRVVPIHYTLTVIVLLFGVLVVYASIILVPDISFTDSQKFSVACKTNQLQVPYYVKKNCLTGYQTLFEESIESKYLDDLIGSCFQEWHYTKCWQLFSHLKKMLLHKFTM